MLETLSEIQRTVTRGFSALHAVLKKYGLISFGFLKKYRLILWKTGANCGRWARGIVFHCRLRSCYGSSLGTD
jgi:hypothetical protein